MLINNGYADKEWLPGSNKEHLSPGFVTIDYVWLGLVLLFLRNPQL